MPVSHSILDNAALVSRLYLAVLFYFLRRYYWAVLGPKGGWLTKRIQSCTQNPGLYRC